MHITDKHVRAFAWKFGIKDENNSVTYTRIPVVEQLTNDCALHAIVNVWLRLQFPRSNIKNKKFDRLKLRETIIKLLMYRPDEKQQNQQFPIQIPPHQKYSRIPMAGVGKSGLILTSSDYEAI